eukprot:TRINITY_DN22578_c0_g2_i1.p1 TRINITY_DN22578_c0_g2~~TRINITY_DN22578_c0_g2_i1.p1  ORF type:complete len:376 (+),score=16.51 TRINITY_DN22578_c0_g2_i1:122-1249(+)
MLRLVPLAIAASLCFAQNFKEKVVASNCLRDRFCRLGRKPTRTGRLTFCPTWVSKGSDCPLHDGHFQVGEPFQQSAIWVKCSGSKMSYCRRGGWYLNIDKPGSDKACCDKIVTQQLLRMAQRLIIEPGSTQHAKQCNIAKKDKRGRRLGGALSRCPQRQRFYSASECHDIRVQAYEGDPGAWKLNSPVYQDAGLLLADWENRNTDPDYQEPPAEHQCSGPEWGAYEEAVDVLGDMRFKRDQDNIDTTFSYKAYVEGSPRPIGLMILQAPFDFTRMDADEGVMEIRALCGHPWTKGGAGVLVQHAKTVAKDLGYHTMEVISAHSAEAFYERQGFTLVSKNGVPIIYHCDHGEVCTHEQACLCKKMNMSLTTTTTLP